MNKIENITQACRALAEWNPEKYKVNMYGFSWRVRAKGGIFESTKLVYNYIDFEDLCSHNFDSILELEGLRYLFFLDYAPHTNLYKFFYVKLFNLDWEEITFPTICLFTLVKEEASQAAFIAAVNYLINKDERLVKSNVTKSLPDYDNYIVTTEDSEENHFVNYDSKESAINLYKCWSKGESVMAKNTRIYKAVDITEDVLLL